MTSRRLTIFGLSFIGGSAFRAAWGDEGCRLMDSKPAANAVIQGRSSEFFVRFDRPVDHIRSSLTILRDGKLVERLKPRLESAPAVLFARAPTLGPGEYLLRWTVRTMEGVKVVQGDIPFTVKRPP